MGSNIKLDNIITATYKKGQRPNDDQLKAIRHVKGPLLMVAGPGSGKTQTLITRTLNLLLVEEVNPENILLCTFTVKAARQLRDRLNADLKKCGADNVDIHEMSIGTIHSICQKIIDEYPNEAGVGVYSKTRGLMRGYKVLDDLTRMFFLMDNFEEIFGEKMGLDERYLGLWKGYWDTIKRSQEYFDKITEENIDLKKLRDSDDEIVSAIGKAMTAYRRLIIKKGRVDFAHLEWLALDLLTNHPGAREEFQSKFEYVMVDEYQDTNYIQEQTIFRLASADRNIAVVGDVDQSIYRFRGATTQNILEFPDRVGNPSLEPINMGINYRSSQQVIDLYQSYRDEINWKGCRYDLNVESAEKLEKNRPPYKATIKIDESDASNEGKKIVDLIVNLKKTRTIEDYNQVAVLLHSVRSEHSQQYIDAIKSLQASGEKIDVYAPRARMFFERPEIMCTLAALHSINPCQLRTDSGGYPGAEKESIKEYIYRCVLLFRSFVEEPGHKAFIAKMKELQQQMKALKAKNGKPKKIFLDYFYSVVNTNFFAHWLDDELPARHLAQLSRMVQSFSEYYGHEWIGGRDADKVWEKFFNSFIRVLNEGGINEYEDKEQAFPSGAVQVMTFHQSKGLEFPVVIVGSLYALMGTSKKVNQILGDFYNREIVEPISCITEFDKRRIFYVAFSRAKDFLVLTGHNDLGPRILNRKKHFKNVLKLCQTWDVIKRKGDYNEVKCKKSNDELMKPVFGFTSHISAYQRCPQQFKYRQLYDFAPSRNAQLWMGNVIHNTLKDLHDHVMKGKAGKLDEHLVERYLDQNIESLTRAGINEPKLSSKSLAKGDKPLREVVITSIKRYVRENKEKLKHCKWAEKEILVDHEDYTLTGVIDLLIHDKTGHIDLVDFKGGRKKTNLKYRDSYADQVRLYCQQTKKKLGKHPDEAYLYWVTEPDGTDPKDPIETNQELLDKTIQAVDNVARKIISKEFPKLGKREESVCGICEFEERCWR